MSLNENTVMSLKQQIGELQKQATLEHHIKSRKAERNKQIKQTLALDELRQQELIIQNAQQKINEIRARQTRMMLIKKQDDAIKKKKEETAHKRWLMEQEQQEIDRRLMTEATIPKGKFDNALHQVHKRMESLKQLKR